MQNQISADAAKYHVKVIFGLYLDYYWVINSYKSEAHALIGPVGSNHGSLARARARGAGSPQTAQSLLLALGRYRTQTMRAME